AKADRVQVKIFDVSGRLVRTLADRMFEAGEHSLRWDGSDNDGRPVARGVYFTQVKYKNSAFSAAKKITVLQ
ncbi:MAG: FlgD immunoglobulin-like domain containing protein, partial [Egibacteraceae bacterium]